MPVCPSLLARMSDNYSTHAGGVTPQVSHPDIDMFMRITILQWPDVPDISGELFILIRSCNFSKSRHSISDNRFRQFSSLKAHSFPSQADTRPYNIFVRWRRPFCLNEQALSVTRKQRYLEQDCLHWVQKRRAAMGDLSSPTARGFHRYTSREYEKFEGVLSLDWVQSLLQEQDTSSVMTAGAMVSEDSLLPKDHMVILQLP